MFLTDLVFRVARPAMIQSQTPPASGAESDSLQNSLSVLVVEDARATADILGLFFETEGHRVRVVYDGAQAVKQVRIDPPDLILMDLGMPEMNGLDATMEIRTLRIPKRVAVIALSAFDDEDMIRRCSEIGFDGHLTKPADPEELRELIRSLFPSGTVS